MSYAYASFHAQSRSLLNARFRYEAARSFDLDDDLEFCPALLSEEELQSVHSGSDRSSLSSGSPNGSPLQHQIQPSSASSSYSFSSHSSFGGPINYHHHHQHHQQKSQQSSQRIRNAIPIVNPNTGMRVSSPPNMIPHPTQRPHHHTNSSRRW
ncbi:hypothetical protein TWF106_004419 [Orbilia oligospora]|uniref:Uncharacterized protein n=1 Tax=Orbilia oligospora TaxID=2813651 RepID=A0A6G1MJT0_ORBOL|nr:hypothetical protein TWF788_002534 [Orbilia oligospora]KAF3207359.1 hypothetical protein TWF679_008426 [Orbilia oligospora]KAF3224218.1 hypothetical protein TWF106_004419 [Orbilia oligospora]KAF3230439.1 hypothetical protein TWF191_010323 [Orbilia oligospora]KAF3260445.1 hypothetical protein TWF192_009726 [Orbilia oligospora]